MSSKAQLLAQVLDLPPSERADLAAEILASLDPPERRSEQEWLAEIERRARDTLAGSPGMTWEQARKLIETRLRGR